MIVTKAFPSLVTSHSCFSEKFRMGAPQWKNALNTFLHRIVHFWFQPYSSKNEMLTNILVRGSNLTAMLIEG